MSAMEKRRLMKLIQLLVKKLDKCLEVTAVAINDREKMPEKQQQLANSKVEAARLNAQVVEKQLKCKMLDTNRELLIAPTTNMDAYALAEKALESM
jgi:hypothetical protein